MSGALHRAVLKTRRVPGLEALYRGAYAAACALSSRALGGLSGISGVYLHRGLTRQGWEPGVSDIDLILLREEADEGGLPALAARLKTLRRLLPMLGDLWLGSPEEVRAYLRWGGLRAWEDAPDWKLLRGRGVDVPALEESPLKRRWLDPWAWLFVSHMELSRRYFAEGEADLEKREADLRKMYWEVVRYSDSILAEGDAAPRTRAQAALRAPAALSARELWLDSSLRLGWASRLVLEKTASAETSAAEFPAPPPERREGLRRLLAEGGGRCVVSDMPYHTYLILAEGADAGDYGRAAAAVLKEPPSGVALVLEPSAWALALQSSYLGAPLGWLGSGGGMASAAGASLFPGWGACASGDALGPLPLLPARLRWETAAEAASWMLLWWRILWISPGWSNRFVLYHLYTRALGLRLLLAGEASGPFCDWELLLARLTSLLPEHRRFLIRTRSLLSGARPQALGSTLRGELSAEHPEALARLMGGLRESLARPPC